MKDNHDTNSLGYHQRRFDSAAKAVGRCFPAANQVASRMDDGAIDRALPEALRALSFAVEALLLSQRELLRWCGELQAGLDEVTAKGSV